MKTVRKHLEKLRLVERKKYHPLIHKIHKKHRISRKTLFYVKEYGSHANVPRTIVRESIKILVFASIISSFGGLALEQIKAVFISIMPLIILVPALNDMIGDYGIIVSSRFSSMLHEKGIKRVWWMDSELRRLFAQIIVIALLTAVISSAAALAISAF